MAGLTRVADVTSEDGALRSPLSGMFPRDLPLPESLSAALLPVRDQVDPHRVPRHPRLPGLSRRLKGAQLGRASITSTHEGPESGLQVPAHDGARARGGRTVHDGGLPARAFAILCHESRPARKEPLSCPAVARLRLAVDARHAEDP